MRTRSLGHLSRAELRSGLMAAAANERTNTATVLTYVAEFDDRRLYLEDGYPSMFAYCVHELRYSEHAAFLRIHAARAARRYPVIIEAVATGRLHLTAIAKLAPYLTRANAAELLEAGVHKTKAEILSLIAERFPKPDLPTRLREIPAPGPAKLAPELGPDRVHVGPQSPPPRKPDPAGNPFATIDEQLGLDRVQACPPVSAGSAEPRPRVEPLAPRRFALQLTMSQEMNDKLQHARNLLSHQLPSGDLAVILERGLDALIRELERRRIAATTRPRASEGGSGRAVACKTQVNATVAARRVSDSRHVPAAVRHAVWKRDQGCCTFVGANGRRCASRSFLEYDHVVPVARGGRATVDGIRLRCRFHNQYTAELEFGGGFMERKRLESACAGWRPGAVDPARVDAREPEFAAGTTSHG